MIDESMIDESALISVIVLGSPGDARRAVASECFDSQTWKNRELLVGDDLYHVIREAKGLYCVVWLMGYRYRPHTLATLAAHAGTDILVEVRDDGGKQLCYIFFRRSVHTINTQAMCVVRVGAGGVVDPLLARRQTSSVFYHSGNTGDIVYSMAFMQAMGGGKVILGPKVDLPKPPAMRETMCERLVENLRPLLLAQPYVSAVEFSGSMPPCDYDLNQFRLHGAGNLVEQVFTAFNVCKDAYVSDTVPWLEVENPAVTKPVVINRTARWRNPKFDWKRVLATYRGMLAFVGTEEEHEAFCREHGAVPYRRTENLLELARVIAGCQLFIGNQSTAYAIAEGLKKDTVQETCPEIPNCKFVRPNALYGEGAHLYLPDAKPVLAKSRSLRGLLRSALREGREVALNLLDRDYDRGTRALLEVVDDFSRNSDYLAGVLKESHPSVLEQTPWPCQFFEFPPSEHVYYNPSLAQFNGQRWLLTRRAAEQPRGEFSDVVAWRLNCQLVPKEMVRPELPRRYVKEQWEDARAITVGDKLLLNCCNYVSEKAFAGHQHLALLNADWATVDHWEPVYGNNAPMAQAKKPEKNWVFFEHAGKVHLVYSIFPHRVVEMPWKTVGKEHITTRRNILWRYGEPRGGTPPVRVGDEYFSFFHSSLPCRTRSRRYYAGAYAFKSEPPFEITRMSCVPLLFGSELDPLRRHLPYVVFPAGAFYEGGVWTMAFGVNDCRCAWMRIPHFEFLQTLRRL